MMDIEKLTDEELIALHDAIWPDDGDMERGSCKWKCNIERVLCFLACRALENPLEVVACIEECNRRWKECRADC